MLNKPVFELLPIALIATSIVFIVVLHSLAMTITGILLIVGACYLLYHRLQDMSAQTDGLDYSDF